LAPLSFLLQGVEDARLRPIAALRDDLYGGNKSGAALARVEQVRAEQAARAGKAAGE